MKEMFSEEELKFFEYQERKIKAIMELVVPLGDETFDKLDHDPGNEYLKSVLALCNEVLAFVMGFLIGDEDEDENE